MKWFIKAFRQYADFSGRASRQEFWMFVLFNLLTLIVLGGGLALLGESLLNAEPESRIVGAIRAYFFSENRFGCMLLSIVGLYNLAASIPAMAVTVRRLHDTGRSAWWILVGLIPFVGSIWLLVLMALPGNPVKNRYGDLPVSDDFTPQRRQLSAGNALILCGAVALIGGLLFYGLEWYDILWNWSAHMRFAYVITLLLYLVMIFFGIQYRKKGLHNRITAIALFIPATLYLFLSVWTLQSLISLFKEGWSKFLLQDRILFVTEMSSILLQMLLSLTLVFIGWLALRNHFVGRWAKVLTTLCSLLLLISVLFSPHMEYFHWENILRFQSYLMRELNTVAWIVLAIANLAAAEKEIEYKDKHP